MLRVAGLLAALGAFATPAARAQDPPETRGSLRISLDASDSGDPPPIRPVVRRQALFFPAHLLFVDPNPYVVTKEFALFQNVVPAPLQGPGKRRELFHIIYQRSAGPQAAERSFGHAWSADLRRWTVDTLAFATDTTAWNEAHVWAPSLVRHDERDYLFYVGVDRHGDQSIGYVSAPLLDTTNTEWDSRRTQVLRAQDTRWAVPDPSIYSGLTQFRDPFVIADPEHPGRLLMYYAAHDSVSFAAGVAGLAVGIARSEPGSVDRWQDLGYVSRTLQRFTKIRQLEGPHVVRSLDPPHRWWLMYSSAGTPPGEAGQSTIRIQRLRAGRSPADTSHDAWNEPETLMGYLGGQETVFGWSGSEHLRFGRADLLAGFTAWGPLLQGIAVSKMNWNGGEFSLGFPAVLSVDEYRSPARELQMSVVGGTPGSSRVEFRIETKAEAEASLEVFDVAGRRRAELFRGRLSPGTHVVTWPLGAAGERAVEAGVYYARLAFPGGIRTATLVVSH